MAFEKLRTIVITAIPKPRSRRKVPQDCRNHPNSPKTRFEDAMLIPSENEISRAGPLLAICRSQSIHYGSPDNPQRNIRHQEEQDVADFVENDSREVDHVTMFGRYPEPFQYDSVQPSLRNKNHNGPHGHKTNVEDHTPKQCLANLCDVHRGFSLMSKIRPLTAFRLWEKAARNRGQRSFPRERALRKVL